MSTVLTQFKINKISPAAPIATVNATNKNLAKIQPTQTNKILTKYNQLKQIKSRQNTTNSNK
jgi:hypothetical protein